MTEELGTGKLNYLILKLSVPAILSMLSAAVYNLVDRIFVGRINPLGLTAIGITMPFQIIQMAFVLMVGIGGSTLISVECGRGDYKKAEGLLEVSLWYFIGTQLLVTILGIVFLKPLFQLLGVSASVYPFARDYALIILLGGIPGLTGYCLNNSVRALGYAKCAMTYVMVSSIINIVLDALFVLGLGWGVKGAAFATILSETIVTLCVLRFFLKHPIVTEWNPKSLLEFGREKQRMLGEITLNGLPIFYMQTFGTIVNIMLNRYIMCYGGDYQLASVTIIASMSQFFLMVVYGVGQGTQPIFGFNYGAEQMERTKKCLKISLGFIVGFMLLVLILLECVPELFIRLFTKDEELIKMTAHNAKIYLCMLPMVGIHSISTTFLQSIKKPKPSTVLYILRFGGILIPALLIFPRFMGIDGVYVANAVSDGLSGLTALLVLFYFLK